MDQLKRVKTGLQYRWLAVVAFGAATLLPGADLKQAENLFDRAQYENVIRMLSAADQKDGAAQFLLGKSYFVLGEFKKSTEAFERVVAASGTSEGYHWLGKAFGRRAETSNPLMAPGYASKARQNFEKAVELDGRNMEAVNDLFTYYLEAPGFLGGGLDKAQNLAAGRIKSLDQAEYHYALAQIAERRKEVRSAEQHLRTAVDLAPRQVGRVIDLARFLSKQGRTQESEQILAKAAAVAPDHPRLLFERAHNLIRAKQNLPIARELLERYVKMPLSPDDPSREEALKLLKAAGA